jgi:hypothetical protein
MAEGVEGLVRDKSRKPGKEPLPPSTVKRVIDLGGRCNASFKPTSSRRTEFVVSSSRRTRSLPRSSRTSLAYVDPPAHAIVLSVDEKSQIQALDRTQPGLPMKPGRAGTMTHDYKRHGTTTLFAALNILDGTIIGRSMQRHRHQEFIRFLNTIEAQVPAGKVIHAIVDN